MMTGFVLPDGRSGRQVVAFGYFKNTVFLLS
jgi:hypothetical protein